MQILLLGGAAWAQAAAPPQTTEDALRQLVNEAGVIFSGTVTAVRRPAPAAPGAAAVVEIDFAVTDAVRGVSGSSYTLREWAGLWPGSDQPFRPGQRYLMLLHTPNPAGLSSPVGGPDGAIPIRALGAGATATTQTIASAASIGTTPAAGTTATPGGSPAEVVDLGWIATRVAVSIPYSTSVAHVVGPHTIQAEAPASGSVTAARVPVASASGLPATIPASVRALPYGSVVSTLRAWEAARHGAL
jgi:hypothetical protein